MFSYFPAIPFLFSSMNFIINRTSSSGTKASIPVHQEGDVLRVVIHIGTEDVEYQSAKKLFLIFISKSEPPQERSDGGGLHTVRQ